jgi:CBS domain-containing protein
MKVSDLMAREVEYISPEASVVEAAELMGELDVGALPAGSAGTLEGVITDRDILYRVVARGRDPREVLVREVLSRPVIACAEDDSLKSAMDMMAANHVRRLPVQNPAGEIVGWITLADMARALLVGSAAMQDALREITEAEPEV